MKQTLFFVSCFLTFMCFGQYNFELVEIDPTFNDTFAHNFIEFNGEMYFTATTQATGTELWKYNGTTASLIKDINPTGNSAPRRLTIANNTLFFTADNGVNGRELWKTDGTEVGTVMVKDILTGIGNGISSTREPFVVFNNSIVFFAQEPGIGNVFLYSSDGIEANTNALATNVNGWFSSNDIIVFGNDLLFEGENSTGTNMGRELWKYSETTQLAVMVKDINTGSADADIAEFYLLNDEVFFIANDGTTGNELWKTDGSGSGTELVKDIRIGSSSGFSNYARFQEFNGYLYFSANDGVHGREIWRTDGIESGTTLFIDINTTGDQYGILETDITQQLFYVYGNKMYFKATDSFDAGNQPNNVEPWITDGTIAGTQLLADLNPNGSSMNDYNSFTSYNGNVFFTAQDPNSTLRSDLYFYDGNNLPNIVQPDNTSEADVSTDFFRPFVFANSLYLSADYSINGISEGIQLWNITDTALSIKENQNQPISIYPNPSTDFITVNTNHQIGKILIYSTSGQLVCSAVDKNKLDISHLATGIYLVKIETNNMLITKRILKK